MDQERGTQPLQQMAQMVENIPVEGAHADGPSDASHDDQVQSSSHHSIEPIEEWQAESSSAFQCFDENVSPVYDAESINLTGPTPLTEGQLVYVNTRNGKLPGEISTVLSVVEGKCEVNCYEIRGGEETAYNRSKSLKDLVTTGALKCSDENCTNTFPNMDEFLIRECHKNFLY